MTTLGCLLLLLTKGFSNIPFEVTDPRKVVHKGSFCFNCLSNKSISGVRYKCANCPNLDCCSKNECQQKHLVSHPNHVFIIIDDILPLAPTKAAPKPQALLQPFDFVNPLTQDHGVKCESCDNNIFGIRYQCANCEEYSCC